MPLLKGGKKGRERLYFHYPHYSNQGGKPSGAIRMGDYKLIEYYEDNRTELFNLETDPGERAGLADKLTREAALLREQLTKWRETVQARMPRPNPNYTGAEK